MFADLHTHSTYSDGTDTPEELVWLAAQKGLSALAVSDHDTIEGVTKAQAEAEKWNIHILPAVEISTSVEGIRIHILGYGPDCAHPGLLRFLKEMSDARTQNTRRMLQKLQAAGKLKYAWEDVLRHHSGKSWLCSMDVFEAMRRDGFYKTRTEWKAFYHTYFGKNSPVYLDLEGFTAKAAIEVILAAGGIPVVAHPKLIGDDRQIEKLIEYGLQGIEAYYPAHDEVDLARYLETAGKYNLLVTGGTDWHGDFTEWSVTMGDWGVDKENFEKLRRKIINFT
jgi:3',5'-nucleoside bisphosphate phosphatase